MESLQPVGLLAYTYELDGKAGHRLDGQGGATPGIAIHLGQDKAGQSHFGVELLGDSHGILAGHGVHHQQYLPRLHRGLYVGQLLHQFFVDVQAAAGIQDQPASRPVPGCLKRVLANSQRLAGNTLGVDGNVELLAQHRELLDSRRPAGIGGHQHRGLPGMAEVKGQLGGGGGLTGALQTDQHGDMGGVAGVAQGALGAAQNRYKLLIDNLDDLLARGEAFQDRGCQRALPDPGQEVLHHLEIDIGLEKGQTHLPQGLVDILFAKSSLAGQALENLSQLFG